ENGEIEWTFETGELVKIRITNDARSFHPMQHPIHLHGQRFVVLAKDGVAVDNLAWKDTALVPVGSTFDLLVEMTNPGDWMLHCHIAEHLEAGMKTVFTVTGEEWLGGRHPP
ncbi:MAG: multicopper oxidase domain-containing protein, partial [Gemmatimonadota bacterium]|nr:multicopper oxidase domain-containing protein [Gemmatimonadota bacterium]